MELKPGYKQTEVGVIPESWTATNLGDVCQVFGRIGFRGYTVDDIVEKGQGAIAISPSNIRNSKMDLTKCTYISLAKYEESPEIKLFNGDILLVKTGSTFGKTAIVQNLEEKATLNPQLVVLKNIKVNNAFLSYMMCFETIQEQISEFIVGGALPTLSQRLVAQFKLPLPPTKAEQEAIAEALSDTDALIESLEQLITKKRHIKQGVMQELFCPKTGDEVRLLRDVSTLKGRIGWQGLNQTEFTSNDDEPFLITGMNFKDGAIRWNEVYHISELRYEIAKDIQLKSGDVLMTKDGTIGKVLYIDTIPFSGKASLNSHLLLFRPIKESYNSKYLYYQLCSQRFKNFIELSKYGTTFFGISQAAVGTYPVLLPPIEDQVHIAKTLSDMDAEIDGLETKLAKTRHLKQGMMHNLLTGRIRLVSAGSKVIPFPGEKESVSASTKSHNWQINEAVIIAVLAKHFGSEEYPLARKRCTKLTYLLHRHVERKAEGYLKKAAGPYNPATKYKGPEAIAQKNGYIRLHHNGTYPGFVIAANISQAEAYFQQWYGPDTLVWLEQFRRKKTDELELLATVDMAMEDLRCAGKAVKLGAVKQVIQDHLEWEAKLQREIFSDINIVRAIQTCRELFA